MNRSFIISSAKITELKIQGNERKTTRIEKTLRLRADFYLAAVMRYFLEGRGAERFQDILRGTIIEAQKWSILLNGSKKSIHYRKPTF